MTSTIYYDGIVHFDVYIKRKPLFLCITLVLPILLVSFVNLFVFILPIGSGERTSFSVTIIIMERNSNNSHDCCQGTYNQSYH
jgi:hypothetical protein